VTVSDDTPAYRRTKRHRSERDQFLDWLAEQQRPNRKLIKKGNSSVRHIVQMSPGTAELLLAVYDEILLPSPATQLQICLLDLSRHPRKGSIQPCPISDA
jgi:hypothetical protein